MSCHQLCIVCNKNFPAVSSRFFLLCKSRKVTAAAMYKNIGVGYRMNSELVCNEVIVLGYFT